MPESIEPRPRMYVSIPPERIGVVIGKEGSVKMEISRRLGISMVVDTENSMVILEPKTSSTPPVNVMKAAEIVKAIAYGFTPDKAMSLINDDFILLIIDLKQIVGDKENHLKRVKGRIIGEGGRVKRNIEELTGTSIVVGEYHVAIIGEYERAMAAKEAVEMLVEGRMHSTVYRRLDMIMREIRRKEKLKLWKPE